MKIGIDISQLAYPHTGVANYLSNLVEKLIEIDHENEYILFFSSFRRKLLTSHFKFLMKSQNSNVKIKEFKIPPAILNFLWNDLHIIPIESFIGDVDVFITSDWAEPPTKKARKISIIYDLIVYKYPEETHNQTEFSVRKLQIAANIVATQKKRLSWIKKESSAILCISQTTKKDAEEILHIDKSKLHVIYPGFTV